MAKRKKWRDITLTDEEVRARRRGRRGKRPLTIGDLIDTRKLHQIATRSKKRARKERLQKEKVGKDVLWLKEKSYRQIAVPPEGCDVSIIPNWVWFYGRAKGLERAFGVKHHYVVNQTVALMPTLVVKRDLLVRMNKRFSEQSRHLLDLSCQSKGEMFTEENCCLAADWGFDEFIKGAENPHISEYCESVLVHGQFQVGTNLFVKLPNSDFNLCMLVPNESHRPSPWTFKFSRWGVFMDSKVVRVGRQKVA